MSSIATYLNQILRSVYGKDVRQAIHDAISECYDDVNAPALQTEAMQAAVQAKIDAGEMAALTIGDGTITGVKIADGAITEDKLSDDINLDTVPAEVKNALYTLLANAAYTSDDMSDQLGIIGEWADASGEIDTTAKVVKENMIMLTNGVESAKEYGGITKVYKTSYPTTTLHLAGIIPTTGNVIATGGARLVPYDADGVAIDYVKENDGNYNRWAQDATGTMTEFTSPAWSVRAFTSIVFTVDMRYLDDAYMYNYATGQVYFAGKNTPYYGMRNISQAS